MNTAALLVDILIIGIQVLIWVSGLLSSFIFSPFHFVANFEKSPSLFSLLAIALAYTLGIVFDYIIAWVFGYFKSKEEKAAYKDGKITVK